MTTAVLDTEVVDATGAELTLTTETIVTLYVKGKTGTHNVHCVMLEVSPDGGTTWLPTRCIVSLEGEASMTLVATKVRAKVIRTEGATSTVDVWLLAK